MTFCHDDGWIASRCATPCKAGGVTRPRTLSWKQRADDGAERVSLVETRRHDQKLPQMGANGSAGDTVGCQQSFPTPAA
jgi:hypothetical protein